MQGTEAAAAATVAWYQCVLDARSFPSGSVHKYLQICKSANFY